jgi:hypothetical protein
MNSFRTITIDGQKTFDSSCLPLVVIPPDGLIDFRDYVAKNLSIIQEKLLKHGAILFS